MLRARLLVWLGRGDCWGEEVLRSALATALFVWLGALSASANTMLYKCDFKKGVFATSGSIEEQPPTLMDIFTPLTIDLESGVVRMGKSNRVSRWRIVAEHDQVYDWILKRAKGGSPVWDRADDVIRIRFYEGATTIVYYYSGNLFSGTCKGLD